MIQNRTCLLVAQAAFLGLALNLGSARATITVQDYWHMGENDPGARPGAVPFAPTVDSVGSRPLSFVAEPFWESVTSSSATSKTGSSLCLYFFVNTVYSTNALIPSLTNNFGIEFWVNPDRTSTNQCLVYNGDTGNNGWGIYQFGATYQGLFGGQAYIGSAAATAGTWTHLALVRNNGTATFYVNGVAAGSAPNAPNPAVGTFNLGINPVGGVHDQFLGYMDEMRLFTFAPGQFSTSDLLFNAGQPAATTGSVDTFANLNAIFHGTVNPEGLASTYYFQYGTTTNYGSNSASGSLPVSTIAYSVSSTISNLSALTLYHYRLVAANSAGTTNGADSTFTTATAAPGIISVSAGSLTTSNAQLAGVVNPNGSATTIYFVYGFDTNYGSYTAPTSIGSGVTAFGFTNLVSYLFGGCAYHFALVASNGVGKVTSQDYTFTLPGAATPTVPTTVDGGPGSLRQAILDAAGGGTINISATGTITLTNPLPAIFKTLTINGPGAGNLIISGNNLWRPFFVDAPSGTVTIKNVTLANGLARGGTGGSSGAGGGGGMGAGGALFVNSGSVILSNLVFASNSAVGGTGGNSAGGGGGGGGGLGGNGGSTTWGSGGGGGFLGNGAGTVGQDQGNTAAGGGGGYLGNGGMGGYYSGGGGGAFTDGGAAQTGSIPGDAGLGGAGGGGNGATGNFGATASNGSDGQMFGGGGGAGAGGNGGWGGAGGKFGGGAGGDGEGVGGAGGDFGGGGGANQNQVEPIGGGQGGFGGGGGANSLWQAGAGGFGGGGGGSINGMPASGGPLGGFGGAGGGGGAALGGAVFVRTDNGASLILYNSSLDAGLVSAGTGGPYADSGQAAGSSIFWMGGTNVISVTAGTNTIAGTLAEYHPSALAKNGNGTLVLSGGNSYSGSTLLNAGTLIVNGDNTSSSNLYVASGATLAAGTGVVGQVALKAGGTIAPGIATLNAGNSVWAGAGNYNWQLYDAANSAGIGYGTVNINGTLDVSAASNFGINLWTLSSLSPPSNGNPLNFPTLAGNYSWTLVHTTGGIVGFNPNNFAIYSVAHNGAGGFSSSASQVLFTFGVTGNDLVLTLATRPFLSAQPVTAITTSSATLNAQVNPYNAASYVLFVWGASTAYGATNVLSVGSGSGPVSVTNGLSNLFANTLYHYQIIATNALGIVSGGDQSFTTLTTAASVVTLGASNITSTSATINGTVNPENLPTTWYFQYGLTTSYGGFSSTQAVPSIALSFNGLNQAAYLPSPLSGLAAGNAPHTIEAWLKPTLLPPSREWVLLLDGQHAGAHHWLLNQDGSTQIGTYLGAQVHPVLSSNVWTHLAASFDGTNLTVYTNGVSAGTVATSFSLANFALTLAQGYSGESYYGGGMDELRIWNTGRTATQIQANMNTPLSGNEYGLIAYCRMDEGTGSTLSDASGHGNTFQTINNPAWTTGSPVGGMPSAQPSTTAAVIAGLTSGTVYHYRLVASNSVGITYGSDSTFTTLMAQATSPLVLTAPIKSANGTFQFAFTNTPGASFTVLATTNINLPLANWTALSNVVENPPGHFQFTDLQATNNPRRFYRVRSP